MKKHGRIKINGKAKRRLAAMILAGLAMVPSFVYAAEADWQTVEYFSSRGLDIVNAAAAYDRGFTGKGVRLGVCDQPTNFRHPDFSGKIRLGVSHPRDACGRHRRRRQERRRDAWRRL